MRTKNKEKFEAVILAVVIFVVIAAAGIGIMAATGVFKSDKESALKLLAQIPEKMSRSYISDHLGMQEWVKTCAENGSATSIHMSDFKLSEEIAEEFSSKLDFSQYEMQIDSQASADGKKTSSLFSLAKGDDRLSVVAYTDEDKSCFAFPELSSGKVLTIDKKKSKELSNVYDTLFQNRMEYITSAKYREFQKAFEEFLQNEVDKVYEELSCEETEQNTYQLTIPKDTLDTVADDFYNFMSGQEDTVKFFNSYLPSTYLYNTYLTYDYLEEEEEEEDFQEEDFLSLLKKAVETLKKESSDFVFCVKGKGDDISEASFDVTFDGAPYSLSLNFEGKEDCKAQLLLKTTQDEENISIEVVMKDEKTDLLEESFEINVLIDDITNGKFAYTATIDPKDNKCNIKLLLTETEEEDLRFEAEGKVKNLNPGKSVSFELDKVSLGLEGQDLLTMAMNLTLGTLESEIEPPKGEEIDGLDVDDSKMEEFSEEVMQNGLVLLEKWGIIDEDELGYSGLLDDDEL